MGQFETKATVKQALPEDVPSASEAAGSQPDGAIYKSSTGKRFRLRHAHWQPVIPRAPRAGTAAAATTAPAAKA
jgi:hypothetical protein